MLYYVFGVQLSNKTDINVIGPNRGLTGRGKSEMAASEL